MIDFPPARKLAVAEMTMQKPKGALEQALMAIGREQKMQGLQMKHGMRPLRDKPMPPKGMATHKGNIY